MRTPSVVRAWATIVVSSIVLLLAAPALAQVTIGNPQSLARLDATGVQVPKRSAEQTPEGVSYQDCVDDQKIRFPLQLSSIEANAIVEAWASVSGADCAVATYRTGATARCWPVTQGLPLQLQATVDIPVRTILSGVPNGPSDLVVDASLCGRVDHTNVSVSFLYFAPGQASTASARAVVDIAVDTVPSPPPNSVQAEPGDGHVAVRWTKGGADDGGEIMCGVNDGAPAACSPITFAGGLPPASPSYGRCGAATSESAQISAAAGGQPLAAGTSYAFAVRSVDRFGNVSPVSATVCAIAPAPAEGEPGCTASRPRPASGWPAYGLGLAVLLLVRSRLKRTTDGWPKPRAR